MTDRLLEAVVAAHDTLIAALDRGSAEDVFVATETVEATLAAVRAQGGVHATGQTRRLVDQILQQGQAVRARVNYLAADNRERMRRLAEHRGLRPQGLYDRTPAAAPRLRLI